MGREHRILTGLEGTDVPAPRPVALCEDEDGHRRRLLRDGARRRRWCCATRTTSRRPSTRAAAARVGEALVDTLADLHAVDPDAAGLGELGRRDGYAERQLKRWKRQWEDSKTRELAAMDETHRLLSARVPAAGRRPRSCTATTGSTT